MKNAPQRLLIPEAFSYLSSANFKDMGKLINLVGKKYSRLTVLSFIGHKGRNRLYRCACDCGTTLDIISDSILSGKTRSCGCLHKEKAKELFTTHGESYKTKEYYAWSNLRKRCSNSNQKDYGGRGITVCERWNKFENFLSDMGRAPSPKHSVDRMNTNGNYEPSNCRWATKVEQANNTRRNTMIEFNNQLKSLPDWCRELNLNYHCVRARINDYGWPAEKAFQAGKRNRGQ